MKKLLLLFLVIAGCAIAMDKKGTKSKKKSERPVINSDNLHLCDWTTIFLNATSSEKQRMIEKRERAHQISKLARQDPHLARKLLTGDKFGEN